MSTVTPIIRDPHIESYEDQLRAWFRRSPWFGVSLAVHALLIALLFNIPWNSTKHQDLQAIIISSFDETNEILPEDIEPPPDLTPEDIEPTLETPVIVEDTRETPLETPLDDDVIPHDAQLNQSVIGLGPGALGGSGKYGKRRGGQGGSGASQKALRAALDWLARHQHPDGHWGSETFSDMCESGLCEGHGNPTVDVGLTGLALLPFLGAHNTMDEGEYRHVVRAGLRWLKKHQGLEVEGLFGERVGSYFMYNHALAALAMCEGYGFSGSPNLKRPAEQGLQFISRSRNPYKVWRYAYPPTGRDEDNDMSVTGWMVFALASAQDFDLRVDTSALQAASNYIDEMTDTSTYRVGYSSRGGLCSREPGDEVRWPAENIECMTAVGMLCRMLMLEDKDVEPDSIPELKGGARLLLDRLPQWKDGFVDYYYWYYGSYAMYQMSGTYWERWKKAMEGALLAHQATDGCERGSWDPEVDPWGDVGGRVYSTALGALCLEVYFRYGRLLGAR